MIRGRSFLIPIVFVLACIFGMPQPASAKGVYNDRGCPVCTPAESLNYTSKLLGSFTRGVLNTVLGWTELLAQPVRAAVENEPVVNGIGKGVKETVMRTAGGISELITCWKPPDPSGRVNQDKIRSCPLGALGISPR